MRIKITKIIHRATLPNDDGVWQVWCQIYCNGSYRYTVLEFDTWEEAKNIKEGEFIDWEL